MKLFVIGGGISGLATAFRIRQGSAHTGNAVEVCLLEAEDRPGGKIRSESSQGYLMEWGPNGFLDNKPDTLKLCRDLGLEGEILPSSEAARKRYIFSEGILHRVPERPGTFFRSPLLSLQGRLRILKELWAPVTPAGVDTSIEEFGSRRLGREAMEKLLDPMVSGIFAGDPAIMSLASCFPRIVELESQHGSLIRAQIYLARQEKKKVKQADARGDGREDKKERKHTGAGPAGPGGTLTSLRGGMGRLVDTLETFLGDALICGTKVDNIRYESEESQKPAFRISCRQQGKDREFQADAVVLAVPAHEAARMLERMEPGVSRLLSKIPYAPVAVVGLGFPKEDAPGNLDGFGFLVPYREGLPLLGSLWTSSIFPDRSPAGHVFTRNMLGGWRNGQVLSCDDNELEEMVLGTFSKAMNRAGSVHFRRIVRHTRAIPLYEVGHETRLQKITEGLERFHGLYLTGNAYRGVSLNDCTREAGETAGRVEADFLRGSIRRAGIRAGG